MGMRDELLENLALALADAGCQRDVIEQAERLWEAGRREELIRCLRLFRCRLLEELPEKQKRVDRVDHLIRQTEKSMTVR